MRVTYLGQACTLIEAGGIRLLVDPWLTEQAYLGTWYHSHLLSQAGISPSKYCKDIDFLFLSHEHQDHCDPETLKHFSSDIPLLICKFETPKFKNYLQSLGFTNIWEVPSKEKVTLKEGVSVTIFGTAEYNNDSAILVEGDNCRLFNETDCKLSYQDLKLIGEQGVDIGFFMYSGANWFPMVYDYPPEVMKTLVAQRRQSLLKSLAQRVKVTKARIAVPAAGPCMVLDPNLLWLNSEEYGIFIDPVEAKKFLEDNSSPATPLVMTPSDVWDSHNGFDPVAPEKFRMDRQKYIRKTSELIGPSIVANQASEPPAHDDLPEHLYNYFNDSVSALTPEMRQRINAKLGIVVTGKYCGAWTVDFTSAGPEFVYEGLTDDWTYKIEVEDKLLYPFITGKMPFFEDLLLSLRIRLSRRPADYYNEPLYHFLYEPNSERLTKYYAKH